MRDLYNINPYRHLLYFLIFGFTILQVFVFILVNSSSLLRYRGLLDLQQNMNIQYPIVDVGVNSSIFSESYRYSGLAYKLAPSNQSVQWSHARSAMLVGRTKEAVDILALEDISIPASNSLRLLDTLVVQLKHEYIGTDYLYQDWNLSPSVQSDPIADYYLSIAHTIISNGSYKDAIPALLQVVKFRSFDLYANYYLWKWHVNKSNDGEAEKYAESITFFSQQAIEVKASTILRETFFATIPKIIEHGLWDKHKTINVLSFLIWNEKENLELIELLFALASSERYSSIGNYLLGEYYYRSGDLHNAIQYYQMASMDSDLVPFLKENSYSPYSNRKNGQSTSITDPRIKEIVANLLGVEEDSLSIGKNLIQPDNINSHEANRTYKWTFSVAPGPNNWLFWGGMDEKSGSDSLRIVNLWWPAHENHYLLSPYAEFIGESVEAKESEWLIIKFSYKLIGNYNDMGLGLVGTEGTWLPYMFQLPLPITGNEWKDVIIIGKLPEGSTRIFPLVRNINGASLWFDAFQMSPIVVNEDPQSCFLEACTYFMNIQR